MKYRLLLDCFYLPNSVVFLLLCLIGNTSQALPANSKPITLLKLDWSSQVVMSHVVGQLLEKRGYTVNYLQQAADSQWFLLSSEIANLQVEVWEGSMADSFDSLVQRGLIVDAGSHDALTREEWWYPLYVKEQCPGLPDWQALKSCVALFSEDSDKRGKYYTGPWEKPDRARIRSLDLPFDVVTLKDSDALKLKLENAIKHHQPILVFNWTPNWVEAVYQGEFVEFPEYQPDCENREAWGINPLLNWDCGNPKNGWLKKAVSRNFQKTWPCAFELIGHIRFSNSDIASAAALKDVEGLDADAAALQWLENNRPVWLSWLAKTQCHASDDLGNP